MALRAKCSGLIFGLYISSVINAPSFRLKGRHQDACDQVDQIGAHHRIHLHDSAFFRDRQTQ
jgi:hypothetical protein